MKLSAVTQNVSDFMKDFEMILILNNNCRKFEELFLVLFILAPSHCAVFRCSYLLGVWGEPLGNLYTCSSNELSLVNEKVLTQITGSHTSGMTNADVKGLWVYGQPHLKEIPSGIGNYFPNLLGFTWIYMNLTSISSEDLKPFPNLITLSLHHNHFVALDGDLLQHTRKLQVIFFDNNLLRHVGHDLLRGLVNLTRAQFSLNPCINMDARTPQEIQDLNLQLPISCPPLATTPAPTTTTVSTTTESGICPLACLGQFWTVEQEVSRHYDDLQKVDAKHTQTIDELGKRLAALETLLSDIMVP